MNETEASGPQMWSRFQQEGLIVDPELQKILKAMKYDNLTVLSKFTKDDEESIVTFMRSTFYKLIKVEEREKFYGFFHENPELFEFVGGQKKTLGFIQQMAKKLVNACKQKTIANLFKDTASVEPDKTVENVATNDAKLVEHTTQLESSINTYLCENFEGTFNVSVKVARDGLGSFIALTPCPVCPKETKITRNRTRWNTSNYYSHLRTHLSEQPEKNSPTLDKFFTSTSTSPSGATASNSSVVRRLLARTDKGSNKRRRVAKSKETNPLFSDEEEMLEVLEGSFEDSNQGVIDSLNEEGQKEDAEKQTEDKENGKIDETTNGEKGDGNEDQHDENFV